MADRWLNGFQMNQVCYDQENKEFVKIANGTCVLDHSSTEAFAKAHQRDDGTQGCDYIPCEAIVYRLIGLDAKGRPMIGFTYRKVDPQKLEIAKQKGAFLDPSEIKPRSLWCGRV